MDLKSCSRCGKIHPRNYTSYVLDKANEEAPERVLFLC